MVKAKTFIKALSLFSDDPRKAKRFLEDKRLSRAEKTILRGYFFLRDSKFDEVKKILEGMGEISDTVVRSQYHLLMGLVHNNRSSYRSAISEINQSLKLLPRETLRYFEFIAHLNLFIIHYNLRDAAEMKKQLDLLSTFEIECAKDAIRYHSCRFLYFCFQERYGEATRVLDELSARKGEMSERDIVAHLLQRFDLSIRLKDFDRARAVLEEMKKNRKFSLSENYRFLKMLLNHYVDHSPLYFQDQEFEKKPLLLHHIKVIQLLEERKTEEAAIWWARLSGLFPGTFLPDFNYKGPENLFSLCLQRHQNAVERGTIQLDETLGKSRAVIEILKKSNGPVNRDVLFRFLWNRDAKDKEDYVRLSRRIYRLRKQFNLNIEYRKGCYLIVPAVSKKAA